MKLATDPVEMEVEATLRGYISRVEEASGILSRACSDVARKFIDRRLMPQVPPWLAQTVGRSASRGQIHDAIRSGSYVHSAQVSACTTRQDVSDLFDAALFECCNRLFDALGELDIFLLNIPVPRRVCNPKVLDQVVGLLEIAE